VNVQTEAVNRAKIDYLKEDIKAIKEVNFIQSALEIEEEETDEDEADEVDEAVELANKLKAAGLSNAMDATPGENKKDQ